MSVLATMSIAATWRRTRARQAGAAEYQVVLGRLAKWTTDSDVFSSLVVPQRNPLPGNERVLSAGRMHGGQIQVGRDLHHPLDANHRNVEKKEKGRRALRRRPCLATAGSGSGSVTFHLPTSTLIGSTQRRVKPLHARITPYRGRLALRNRMEPTIRWFSSRRADTSATPLISTNSSAHEM